MCVCVCALDILISRIYVPSRASLPPKATLNLELANSKRVCQENTLNLDRVIRIRVRVTSRSLVKSARLLIDETYFRKLFDSSFIHIEFFKFLDVIRDIRAYVFQKRHQTWFSMEAIIICRNINPLCGIQDDTKIHVSVNFKPYIQLFKLCLYLWALNLK